MTELKGSPTASRWKRERGSFFTENSPAEKERVPICLYTDVKRGEGSDLDRQRVDQAGLEKKRLEFTFTTIFRETAFTAQPREKAFFLEEVDRDGPQPALRNVDGA